MKTVAELRQAVDPFRLRVAGTIRRMAVTLTAKALWQLAGFRIPGTGDASTRETRTAEPFLGIGFHSRPPASGKPEAIVVMVRDSNHPVVVAVRDEKTRAAIASALAQDETMLFNSQAVVHVRASGVVEVRAPDGTAVALALKSDVESVDEKYAAHVHGAAGASTTGPLTTFTPGTPPVTVPLDPATIEGTTVLRGQ